jgi:hypothetical protein
MWLEFHWEKILTEPREASLVISVIIFSSSYALRTIAAASEACNLFKQFALAVSSVEEWWRNGRKWHHDDAPLRFINP